MSLDDKSKQKSKKQTKRKSKSKSKADNIPLNLLEYFNDVMMCEQPPSNTKHTDNLDVLCNTISHHVSEWLKCYAIIGYTDDGKAVEIVNVKTPMDEHALDGLINQLYSTRSAINGVMLNQKIHDILNDDEEQ